jgi:hypothetical protein
MFYSKLVYVSVFVHTIVTVCGFHLDPLLCVGKNFVIW